jgi:squalene synthase HpnC
MTDDCYAACATLARSHYENFPVASLLLPSAMRPHVAALYAFARIADDIADERTVPADIRRARLTGWQRCLHQALAVEQPDPAPDAGSVDRVPRRIRGAPGWSSLAADRDDHATPPGSVPGAPCTPATAARCTERQRNSREALSSDPAPGAWRDREALVIAATAHTIRSFDLPVALFDDLISAFGQDTTTTRYVSWSDVFDYCRRSANPIGRLVLRIAGYRDDQLDRSSDALCTALQLTNFWQDFGRDWRAGRLYVPREVQAAAGATEQDLSNAHFGGSWTAALARCVAVTAEQFANGRGVCDGVHGRLRYELRCTWLGGRRMLAKVDAARGRLLDHRPALGVRDVPAILWRALCWSSRS